MKTFLRSASIALLAIAVCAPTAGADIAKCKSTIAKASSQFLQARVKALSKCEGGVVKSGTGSCPDAKTITAVDKAAAKMTASIGKACGGDDKLCGGNTNNEPTPAALGWPSTCPNFEKGECTNAITDCGGISTCLECIGGEASDQAMSLYYDDLVPGTQANKPLNKCQITIGKATSAFLNSKSKILQKCWASGMGPCDGIALGDGKYLGAITKAETKKISSICKACGGPDKLCNTMDDLTPAQIGFPATCPLVTIPGGASCAGPITNLQDIIDCVDCVTEFKVDCVDRLQVPNLTSYPAECNACTAPPPTGLCPTSLTFTADGENVDLDSGFTGLAHNAHVPTNGRLTLAVSGCAGVNQPTCGQCNINGPLDNTGGPEFNNHRCQDASWVQCTSNADCTSAMQCLGGANNGGVCTTASQCPSGTCSPAGLTGPCIFFFGSPLPLVAGGVSTCIVNEISGPVSGTINLDDGTSTNNVPLSSKVFPVGNEAGPCPHCTAGVCDNGPRITQACTVTGHSDFFGDVSLDCPPNPGSLAGNLGINLNIATGTQAKTLTATNPNCRQTGYTGLKCFCDTCNNLESTACSANTECPMSNFCLGGSNDGKICSNGSECPGGGCSSAPGICGGRRCIGGTEGGKPCGPGVQGICLGGANHGANCGSSSVCPSGACSIGCAGGGICNRPGEPTQPNSCQDDTSTPMSGCVDLGNNEGECADSPSDQVCSLQTYHACTSAADCQAPACPFCVPGQTCISRRRPCFTDNGVLGNSVQVAGSPDVPCGGVSKPTVGTFFCVAPVSATAVNAAGGLPALGRVRIPGVVDINP